MGASVALVTPEPSQHLQTLTEERQSKSSTVRKIHFYLHTAAVIAQSVTGAHPGAAGSQQHVVQGPALRTWGEVGLDPAEPGSGGAAGVDSKLKDEPLLVLIGFNWHFIDTL